MWNWILLNIFLQLLIWICFSVLSFNTVNYVDFSKFLFLGWIPLDWYILFLFYIFCRILFTYIQHVSLCSWGILVCSFIFVYCLSQVLVLVQCWPYRMSIEVFLPLCFQEQNMWDWYYFLLKCSIVFANEISEPKILFFWTMVLTMVYFFVELLRFSISAKGFHQSSTQHFLLHFPVHIWAFFP